MARFAPEARDAYSRVDSINIVPLRGKRCVLSFSYMTDLKGTNESIDNGVRTAERVVKIGLILSAITSAVILIMVLIGGRERLNTLGFVIPLLTLQCFFYLAIQAKKRSKKQDAQGR